MAEEKKSVILYVDIISTFETMTDKEAGRLIKHFLRYVNDLNPEPPDKITQIAFEPIKQQLKRDLVKWECIKSKRSEAGKASAELRKQKSTNPTSVESAEQTPTNPTVNGIVNVNVNDNVNVINRERDAPEIFYSIEHCLTVAMADDRWVKANAATETELLSFNDYLEKQGKYQISPLDYKQYFAKLKGRYPDLLKPAAKKLSIEDYRKIARDIDSQMKAV